MSKIETREPIVERVLSVASIQDDFSTFRNKHAVKRVSDPVSELYWTYYENFPHKKSGKVDKKNPSIVLLHGICGTAGCYFYLFDKLSELVACVSAQYPEYETPYEWIAGFSHFLDYLNLKKPCVFGSDLGGFLLQLFVQNYPNSLCSIILCNSYRKTDEFSVSPTLREVYGNLYMLLPHLILKNLYIEFYICPDRNSDEDFVEKIELKEQYAKEFMAYELDQISSNDLGLQLTCDYVYSSDLNGFKQDKILLIETNNSNIPYNLKQDIKSWYKNSKVAYMKSGGDFPYLTRPDEIALFIQVHLNNIKYSQDSNYNELISGENKSHRRDKPAVETVPSNRDKSPSDDDVFHDVDYDSENSVIDNFNKNYLL